jgi:aminoglycoside phosphotransferase (APT) family kinase protein
MDETLAGRLEGALSAAAGTPVRVLAIDRVTGGYSRMMRRVTVEVDGRQRLLVWRADPPADQEIVRTDRAREHALLSALDGRHGAPRTHLFDAEGSRLGAVSMVVDYLPGEPLMAVLRDASAERTQELVRDVATLAADIHRADLAALPRGFERPTDWSSYIDGCIDDWRSLAAGQAEPAPLMRYVVEWLDAHRPAEVPLTLLHGDLQTPNVIVGADGVTAIDWEFARIGDPREDLGWFAAIAAISPPDPIAGDLTALCEAYREASGLDASQVNPLTVAYCSILPFGGMVGRFVGQVTDLVEGRNRSLKTANLAYVVTAMVEGWIGLVQQLEAATEVPAP